MSDANNSISLTNTTNCTVYATKNTTSPQHKEDSPISELPVPSKKEENPQTGNGNGSEVPENFEEETNDVPSLPSNNPSPVDTCTTHICKVTKTPTTKEITLKPTKAIQKSKTRTKTSCGVCRKRVGLLGFDCRCGRIFCGTHRYYDTHNCNYDFLTSAKQQLIDENPIVKSAKLLERI